MESKIDFPSLKKSAIFSLGHFMTDIYPAFLPPLLPLLMDKFQLSFTRASFLGMILSFSSSLTQPIFGYLSDKFGGRKFMIMGPLVAGSGFQLHRAGLGLLGDFGSHRHRRFGGRLVPPRSRRLRGFPRRAAENFRHGLFLPGRQHRLRRQPLFYSHHRHPFRFRMEPSRRPPGCRNGLAALQESSLSGKNVFPFLRDRVPPGRHGEPAVEPFLDPDGRRDSADHDGRQPFDFSSHHSKSSRFFFGCRGKLFYGFHDLRRRGRADRRISCPTGSAANR